MSCWSINGCYQVRVEASQQVYYVWKPPNRQVYYAWKPPNRQVYCGVYYILEYSFSHVSTTYAVVEVLRLEHIAASAQCYIHSFVRTYILECSHASSNLQQTYITVVATHRCSGMAIRLSVFRRTPCWSQPQPVAVLIVLHTEILAVCVGYIHQARNFSRTPQGSFSFTSRRLHTTSVVVVVCLCPIIFSTHSTRHFL